MQQHFGHDGTHNSAEAEPPSETCPLCTLGVAALIGLSLFVAVYNAETNVPGRGLVPVGPFEPVWSEGIGLPGK
jgi:hypothetical protein